MKFILHIGTHKTGTTTIQKFLRANENELKSEGLYYPNFDLIGKNKRYAHHEIAHALADKSKNLSQKQAKEFIKSVSEVDCKAAIISAEPFYRHEVNCSSDPWKRKERYIQRVSKAFPEDTEIVVVFREQYEFAKSLFQENVKVNRYSKGFSEFLNDFTIYFDYYKNYKLWSKYFNKVKIMSFSDLASNKMLEKNFIRGLGCNSLSGLINIDRENESLNDDLIEFKRIINGLPFSINRLRILTANLLEKDPPDFLSADKHQWISNDDIDAFKEKYAYSNELMISECKLSPVFFKTSDISYDLFNSLNDEKLSSLIRYYL